MPHINDASNALVNVRLDNHGRNRLNPVDMVPAQTNCSLCACAGVITHARGTVVTSGDVAKLARRAVVATPKPPSAKARTGPAIVFDDPPIQHSKALAGKGWIGGPTSLRDVNPVNDTQVEMFMRHTSTELGLSRVLKMGDSTSGDARRSLKEAKAYMQALVPEMFVFAVLAEGHWNFAHAVKDAIQFIDYQMDHPDLGGKPTAGPDFQQAMGKGGLDESRSVYAVLAFQVEDRFPGGPATP